MVIFPQLYIYIFSSPSPSQTWPSSSPPPPLVFDRHPSPSHHFSIQTSLSFHSKLLNRVGYSEIGMVCSICSSWLHFSSRVFPASFPVPAPSFSGGQWRRVVRGLCSFIFFYEFPSCSNFIFSLSFLFPYICVGLSVFRRDSGRQSSG